MDRVDEKLTKLLDRLIGRTEEGKLEWRRGIQLGSFQADFPDYSVIIQKNNPPERLLGGDYHFRIINGKGDIILSVPEKSWLGFEPVPEEILSKLRRLLSVARSAASPEHAIDALLSELN